MSPETPSPLLTEDEAYQEVANNLLNGIQQQPDGSWRMPWNAVTGGRPVNAFSGRPFRGQNVLMLWKAARTHGFSSHQWASANSWTHRRGTLLPGAVGTPILVPVIDNEATPEVWTRKTRGITKKVGRLGGDPDGGEFRPIIGFQKEDWFNVAQVQGVQISPPVIPSPSEAAQNLLDAFHTWRRAGGPALEHGGQQALWSPSRDRILMPDIRAFPDYGGLSGLEYYASTLAHEAIHATGSKGRLARWTMEKYGRTPEARPREELVAEIGAAFLGARFGLRTTLRADHVHYVRSWIRAIKNDKQHGVFLWAIREAERAADYLYRCLRPEHPSDRPRPSRSSPHSQA